MIDIAPRPAGPEDLATLAALHADAFPEPWSEPALAGMVAAPGVLCLIAGTEGFILIRAIAGEAEVLTLAVAPAARRRGVGRALVEAAVHAAEAAGARTLFLEVATDNTAALTLYLAAGFAEIGCRRGYYRRPGAPAADALVLRRILGA